MKDANPLLRIQNDVANARIALVMYKQTLEIHRRTLEPIDRDYMAATMRELIVIRETLKELLEHAL